MSEASVQQSVGIGNAGRQARPLPVGYGLAAAAAISLGLWGAAIWGLWRLLA